MILLGSWMASKKESLFDNNHMSLGNWLQLQLNQVEQDLIFPDAYRVLIQPKT